MGWYRRLTSSSSVRYTRAGIGDGNLLSSRVEADSHYDVGNKIILVAPGYLPGDSE